MGIYNTVSFKRDDNHFKEFSSPTNIYPGPAAHTALYLGIELNLITRSPREDKSQRILRDAVRVTLLGWHFDHVPDPSGPCRGPPHLHSWEKHLPSGRRCGVWVEGGTPQGMRGPDNFSWRTRAVAPCMEHCSVAVPGLLPSLQRYYFIPSSEQPCQ